MIFESAFTKIDAALLTHVTNTVSNVTADIAPVATTLLLIYMVVWGVLVVMGRIPEVMLDGALRVLKLTIIITIAINAAYYNDYVVSFLLPLGDHVAGLFSSSTSASTAGAYLDDALIKVWKLGSKFMMQASENSTFGVPDIPLAMMGVVVWVIGFILTVFSAALFVLAKIALTLLLGIGPIFILLSMFEATKKFFDAWLGQCFNYILIIILTAGMIGLIIDIMMTEVSAIDLSTTLSNIQALPALGIGGIGIIVLTQVMGIASALGGGIALSALGVAREIGGNLKGRAEKMGDKALNHPKKWAGNTKDLLKSKFSGKNTISK